MGRRGAVVAAARALVAMCLLGTVLVVASSPAPAAPPGPDCDAVGPTSWLALTFDDAGNEISRWQESGPDAFQLVCNFDAEQGRAGIAVTVEYRCPDAIDRRWDGLQADDRSPLGPDTITEIDTGGATTYVGFFDEHQRVFHRIDDTAIATISVHSGGGYYDDEVLQTALDLHGINDGVVDDLPCTTAPAPQPAPMPAPAPVPAPAPAPVAGDRPLCPEVGGMLSSFSAEDLADAGITDPDSSSIRIDDEFLLPDFQQAIRNHNANNPGARAFANPTVPWAGTPGALTWLFTDNGSLQVVGIGDANLGALNRSFVVGDEVRLRDAIRRASEQRAAAGGDGKLTPGEVYELALGFTAGDAKAAMLLSHNTLRALARGREEALTGVGGDPGFFDDHLVALRDASDNAGPWYHLFGTGYYSMVEDGDWGEVLTIGGLLGLASNLSPAARLLFLTVGAINGFSSSSTLSNLAEQLVREQRGRTPDPEKFCFNVWGFAIGSDLYGELPIQAGRDVWEPYSDFVVPDPDDIAFDAVQDTVATRFVGLSGSPFSILWDVDGDELLLDQGPEPGQAHLVGAAPIAVMPVLEDGDHWGTVSLAAAGSVQEVTFEAAHDDADLTYLRVDLDTGDAALYETTARLDGDRLTLVLDDVELGPPMVADDGSLVEPVLFNVDDGLLLDDPTATTATTATTRPPAGSGREVAARPAVDDGSDDALVVLLVLGGLLAGLVVIAGGVAVAVSRRRPRPAVASGAGSAAAGPSVSGGWTPPAAGSQPGPANPSVALVVPTELFDGARATLGWVPAGAVVGVLRVEGAWAEVVVQDGRRGWVDAGSVRR